MEKISINVYHREIAGVDTDRRTINQKLRCFSSKFVAALNSEFQKKGSGSSCKEIAWPLPKSKKKILLPNEGDYSYIDGFLFDADIAICAVPTLEFADGAVGSLVIRKRRLLHICLLSLERIPDYETHQDLYRGLLALPTCIRKKKDHLFYEPVPETDEDGKTRILNPLQGRAMTIDSFPEITMKKNEAIVSLVRAQKEI